MARKKISELNIQDRDVTIQVQVNRKWEFRGNIDDGPILHVDMILTDTSGSAIYAEIPSDFIDQKSHLLDVKKVYNIRRFRVSPSKRFYKAVDAPLMIYITKFTIIELCRHPPSTFQEYVYRLVQYTDINPSGSNSKNFHDVIGVITDVSNLTPVLSSSQQRSTVKRNIIIANPSGDNLTITLWGNKARDFSYDSVYDPQQQNPIVALFVGCLPNNYAALNGGPACHWYFNPDIQEAQPFYNWIQSKEMKIELPTITENEPTTIEIPNREHKTLEELLQYDPYTMPPEGCECTVTIIRIMNTSNWWYAACAVCPKKPAMDRQTMQCKKCGSTDSCFRYKLNFVASDGTAEANMFCFDSIAKNIIGSPCATIMASASNVETVPPEIAAIVSLKFRFIVTYNDESYIGRSKVFLIKSIVTAYGRNRSLPQTAQNKDSLSPDTPAKSTTIIRPQVSPSTAMANLSTESTEPTTVNRMLKFSTSAATVSSKTQSSKGTVHKKKEADTSAEIPEITMLESPTKRMKKFAATQDEAKSTGEGTS